MGGWEKEPDCGGREPDLLMSIWRCVLFGALTVLFVACSQQVHAEANHEADPLAPARSGRIVCVTPDHMHHTCRAFVRFRFVGDDPVTAETETVIGGQPGIVVMRIRNPVVLRGDTYCEPYRQADLDDAEFEIDGEPILGPAADFLRQRMQARFVASNGKEGCTTHERIGDQLAIHVVVKGVHDFTDTISWIEPTAGYSLAAPIPRTAT